MYTKHSQPSILDSIWTVSEPLPHPLDTCSQYVPGVLTVNVGRSELSGHRKRSPCWVASRLLSTIEVTVQINVSFRNATSGLLALRTTTVSEFVSQLLVTFTQ